LQSEREGDDVALEDVGSDSTAHRLLLVQILKRANAHVDGVGVLHDIAPRGRDEMKSEPLEDGRCGIGGLR
jgi:hypothetical protein